MKKLFISQPMAGRLDDVILGERVRIHQKAEAALGEKLEVIDSFIDGRTFTEKNAPVRYLAQSIALLADADVAAFGEGWELARGCMIEHRICLDYGIDIVEVYSEDGDKS